MRSPYRMYDGYCPKCRELKDDGCRFHDGEHFKDQWECRDCNIFLLYPRKVPMTYPKDYDPIAIYRMLHNRNEPQ